MLPADGVSMRLQPKSEARLIATEAPTAGPTPAPTPDVVAFTRTDAAEVRKAKASGGDRNLYGGTLSDATDKSVLPPWYQCGDNSGMVRVALGFTHRVASCLRIANVAQTCSFDLEA